MTSSMLKANARLLIKENMIKIFYVGIAYLLAIALLSFLQDHLPIPGKNIKDQMQLVISGELYILDFNDMIRTGGLVLFFLIGLMLPVIHVGYDFYALKITRKEEADFKELLVGFSLFTKIILLSLITTGLILLWSLLLLFPGIMAYYKYRQAYFILLDDPAKPVMQCINESKQMMNGRKVDLFLIDLSFLGWYALTLIVMLIIPSFPLVYIWLLPYYTLSQATYYNFILKEITT